MPQPLERDLQDTQKRLERWLEARLPAATDLRIEKLRGPSDTGFSSDTLMFDLSRTEAGREVREPLVARLEPSSAFPIFPSYDVALQFEIMRAMGESGVPVPVMRWLERDPGPLGQPFYVMDHVEGRVPTDRPPYHQGGWVFELSPGDRTALWWNGLEAMCQVHLLDPEDATFDCLPRPGAGERPIDSQLRYYDDFMSWGMERAELPLLEQSLAWLRANAPADEPTGICWGDSRLANQIFDGLRCIAVIDWEMVFRGNPEADLGWWIAMDRCFSEGIGLERVPGLPGRDETAARWEERTGRRAANLAYYELFAVFRFSVIMARIGGQMKYYELVPPDHDFAQTNLGSVVLARMLDEAKAGA